MTTQALDWLAANQTLIVWLASSSVLVFIATLIAVPIVVTRLPADYFARPDHHRQPRASGHPLLNMVVIAVKNLLGVILVLAGIAMLVLPGQGLLTIAVGIMLMNFPGKYRLEQWVVSRPLVFGALNWLRRRSGRAPLRVLQNSEPQNANRPLDRR
jgi:hypothetical protein